MQKEQKQFVLIMKILAVVYLVVGFLFFFCPWETIYMINIVPLKFKFLQSMDGPTDRFWVTLTASMMYMLSLIAYFSSKNPREKNYVYIHLLSKASSTLGFLYCFALFESYWAYLLGAITDGSLFFIVLWSFKQMSAKN